MENNLTSVSLSQSFLPNTQVRTYIPFEPYELGVPVETKEMIIELWGAGGNGNEFGGGDAGDYLMKRFSGTEIEMLEMKPAQNFMMETYVKFKIDGKVKELIAFSGSKKNANFSGSFDLYYKGGVGAANHIISFSTEQNDDKVEKIRISELGGDGGNSYYPTITKGVGSSFVGSILRKKFIGNGWGIVVEDNINYSNPLNGNTPGGGGGGGSRYYKGSMGEKFFGIGGLGMVRITYIQ
ncbi:MAG: hypothetical protein IT256_04690 [Chitinophagaceae bacterium]|nr:hypothetical protein [Chitinophagaceae bacterium]